MTTGKRIRLLVLAAVAAIAAACSSSTSTTLVGLSTAVQDLTIDPDGLTTVISFEEAPASVAAVNFEADGGQRPVSVSLSGARATVVWDARVTPSHKVRVVGLPEVDASWRSVSTSDDSAPTFVITSATQDTSDASLGGDTIEVTFSGPRVVESMAEDLNNWDLVVNGTSMDLTGSTFSLDPATQVLDITLGASANLHSTFSLSASNLTSVADTPVDSAQVAGTASGDATAPTLTSVEQNLAQDALGQVVDFTFDEPMDPVFAAIPGDFTLVDHADAIGVTLVLSVEQPSDNVLRLTFSRPVAPGLDTISHSGLMDAHGNAFAAAVEAIGNSSTAVNAFSSVTANTIEGGADTVVVVTDQAFDPDFAEDPARWSMTIGGAAVVMTDQDLSYDLASQTLTITLDSDMRNGDAVIVDAVNQVDVDGEDFTVTAASVSASGDASAPTFVSAVQNRTVDPTGYTVDLTFSEAIHPTQGEDTTNYTFTPAATVDSATIVGSGNVVRVHSTDVILTPGDVTVTIDSDVDDLAGNALGSVSGPNSLTSTDSTAPAPSVVTANANEGADDDTIIVTFDDDMVEAEVEDLTNWDLESPIGTTWDLTGNTVDYNPASRSATLTLDAGGLSLKFDDDLSVAFTTMRDIAGNAVDTSRISGSILAETTLPSVHAAWRHDAPRDGTLDIRFSEPCDNLDDLYDAVTNPTGTRYALRDSSGVLRGYPNSASIVDGGLGVDLDYGFTISLTDTVDVIGAEDLAGNVMFPAMAMAIEAENTAAPAQGSAPTVTAVAGENNDTIVITFSEPMSPWRITDPGQYSVQTNPGGTAVAFGPSDITWDGTSTLTIDLGGPFGDNLTASESYDVDLLVDATNPLRTRQGVALSAVDSQTVSVSGDTVNGPTQAASTALLDTTDANSIIVIFDEAVDETAVEVAANFDYDGGNIATSVTQLSPCVVRATFGVAVAQGFNLTIAQASAQDLAGNTAAADITLAVASDTNAPLLVSVDGSIGAGPGDDTVAITFSEQLDTVTALDVSNYTITNGSALDLTGAGLTWDSVSSTVTIALAPGVELDATQGLSVTVADVADAAGNAMPSPVTLAGTISGDGTAPDFATGFANYRESSSGNVYDLRFDEDVDQAFVADLVNWSTSGTAQPTGVSVLGPDHVRVTLDVALADGEVLQLAAGLEDLAHNQAGALSIDPIDPVD